MVRTSNKEPPEPDKNIEKVVSFKEEQRRMVAERRKESRFRSSQRVIKDLEKRQKKKPLSQKQEQRLEKAKARRDTTLTTTIIERRRNLIGGQRRDTEKVNPVYVQEKQDRFKPLPFVDPSVMEGSKVSQVKKVDSRGTGRPMGLSSNVENVYLYQTKQGELEGTTPVTYTEISGVQTQNTYTEPTNTYKWFGMDADMFKGIKPATYPFTDKPITFKNKKETDSPFERQTERSVPSYTAFLDKQSEKQSIKAERLGNPLRSGNDLNVIERIDAGIQKGVTSFNVFNLAAAKGAVSVYERPQDVILAIPTMATRPKETAKTISQNLRENPFGTVGEFGGYAIGFGSIGAAVRGGKNIYVRTGSEKLFDVEVLSEQVTSGTRPTPLSRSTAQDIKLFEATRSQTTTGDIKAVTIAPEKLSGNVAGKGAKGGVVEDAGLWTTAFGEGSGLRLKPSSSGGFNYNPLAGFSDLFKQTTATTFEAKGIRYLPKKVEGKAGFESITTYFEGLKNEGVLYIPKRSRIGQGEIKPQTYRIPETVKGETATYREGAIVREKGSAEHQAIVPYGQEFTIKPIDMTGKTGFQRFMAELKGYDKYFTFEGKNIPIRETVLTTGSAENIGAITAAGKKSAEKPITETVIDTSSVIKGRSSGSGILPSGAALGTSVPEVTSIFPTKTTYTTGTGYAGVSRSTGGGARSLFSSGRTVESYATPIASSSLVSSSSYAPPSSSFLSSGSRSSGRSRGSSLSSSSATTSSSPVSSSSSIISSITSGGSSRGSSRTSRTFGGSSYGMGKSGIPSILRPKYKTPRYQRKNRKQRSRANIRPQFNLYTASVEATFLQKKSKKEPKLAVLTGIGLRPILKL